ncbi:MAG: hypothetical protein ACRDIU_10620 [Actinomycetota bacterium]
MRLDEEAERALSQLQATGLRKSDAIRKALVEAAERGSKGLSLAKEAAALEADERDRDEMRRVAELMEELRAPR